MNRLAFRGLRERKARTAFTLLAVILGVALIAGTFVLTDTISKSFDKLVAVGGENVDVTVVSRNQGEQFTSAVASFPAAVEAQVAEVEGVAAVAGVYGQVPVTVVDDRGERIGPTTGAPTLAFSAVPERFDPFEYEGRPPRTDAEIAVSKPTRSGGVRIGDSVRVQGTDNVRAYEVVGLTTYAGASSVGGAAFTVHTLPEVQALAGDAAKLRGLDVQAEPGITETELKRRVDTAVGGAVLVRTGAQASADQTSVRSAVSAATPPRTSASSQSPGLRWRSPSAL